MTHSPTPPTYQSTNLPPTNPYVGPRTFSAAQRHLFFGREREARDLLARVLSERLLLFYAQSGAGKSSLLHARLIPLLQEEKGFVVLPVGRVSGELPAGLAQVDNIFVFNLLRSVAKGNQPELLAQVSLGDFLARLARRSAVDADGLERKGWVYDPELVPAAAGAAPGARRYALIADQFEEIITSHPARWREREDFFRQLDAALAADPNLWVVLTLREDYVAALDPYAELCFNRLRARFYMERMDRAAALEAIRGPAELGGRPFAAGAAEQMVDNLRQVRVPGQETTVAGQYVEPVQLQVACYQLWENLEEAKEGKEGGEITLEDLAVAGDVNEALTAFYEETLAAALAHPTATGVSERQLRAWFDEQLITEAGTRGLVHQGKRASGGLPNDVVQALRRRFLVRDDARGGDVWIELVHDSFVGPILKSNHDWLLRQPLVQLAEQWKAAGEPSSMLLRDEQLESLDPSWTSLGPSVQAYIERSQAAQLEREDAQRQRELEQARALAEEQRMRAEEQQQHAEAQSHLSLRLRWLAVGLAVAAVIALAMSMVALNQASVAQTHAQQAIVNEQLARDSERQALENEQQALVNAQQASQERSNARAAFANQLAYRARAELTERPVVGILLAAEASSLLQAEGRSDEDALSALREVVARSRSSPWQAHDGPVLDMAFDGVQLVTASQSGIRRWDIAAWRPDQEETPESELLLDRRSNLVFDIKLSRNGKRAVLVDEDPNPTLLDLASGQATPVAQLDALNHSWVFDLSEDGALLAAGNEGGEIRLFDVTDPDLQELRFSGKQEGNMNQFREPDNAVLSIALSPDGSWLATTNPSGMIYLWQSLADPPMPPRVAAVPGTVEAMAFNSAGSMLGVGGDTGTPWVFAVPFVGGSGRSAQQATGVSKLPTSASRIAALDLNSSASQLAAGGFDSSPSTRIWSVDWQLLSADLRGHADYRGVTAVRFSSDDQWLATGDLSGVVRRWKTSDLPEPGQDPATMYQERSLKELETLACASAGQALTDVLPPEEIAAIFGLMPRPNVCLEQSSR